MSGAAVALEPLSHRPVRAGRWAPRHRRAVFGAVTVVAGGLIVLMTYFPLIFVMSNSLKSGGNMFTNGVFALFNQFDLHNYAVAWSGIDRSLLNTIVVGALSVAIGVLSAALGAYAFSQLRFRGKSVLFMAYVALLFLPWTLTLIPLFLTVQKLHMFNTFWALVFPYSATAQPLLVMIFRGFFDQIPDELLQSARVDGCSERQVLRRVVAPLTRPVLFTGAILVTINVWGDYLWPTIAIQSPGRLTISAGMIQFVNSFGTNLSNGGAVFAAYVIVTAPMFVLVGVSMRYFVAGLTEGALKL